MSKIVTHPGLRTDRNPTSEAIGAIKLPAIMQGVGGWGIEEDFIGGGTPNWILTATETSSAAFTFAAAGGKGGLAVLDTGTSGIATEVAEVQIDGAAFQPTAGASIYFGALFKTDVVTGKLFVGLATEDTALTDGSSVLDVTSHIGFWFNGANVELTATGATNTDTGVDAVADQFIKLEFVVSGTGSVVPFVNGTRYSSAKLTTFPTTLMTPSLAKVLGATEDNKLTTVDWIKCYQQEDLVRVGSA
mgnify:CR=1 FL=1